MKPKFKVVKKLKNLEKRVQAVKNMYDVTFLTAKISKDMEKEVGLRFRNEVDPEGRPWKGLAVSTLNRRQGLTRAQRKVKTRRRRGKTYKEIEAEMGLDKGGASSLFRAGKKRQSTRPKILQDQGYLRRSIKARNTKTEAIVGTNIKYAAAHNFGYRRIPQRRFMGLNRGQRIKYKDWIIKWKKGQLR